ncbi:MAG: beta strand repeat-containing protein [Acidobacteriaceae bacterium]
MHVSRSFGFAAPTPSGIAAASVPRKDHSSRVFRIGPWMLSLIAVFAILALCSRTACAATYTVTDTSDNPADTGSLRYAVNHAANGDTIDFAAGVTGTIPLTNGPLTISASVTITGPGAAFVTISGNSASNVFTINSGIVVLSGLNIANGNAGPSGFGGGIYNNTGTLTVENCIFNANAGGYGGAIMNNFGSTLSLIDTTFISNTSILNGGGAIANYGTMTVSASTFFGNMGGYGGGIENEGSATVSNSTFSGNTGSDGGGIFTNVGATLAVMNSTLSGNSGPNGDVSNYSGGTATLSNSILADGSTNCTQSGPNLIGGTPDLGPLQYNGGFYKTMMPLPGSPAIGAGLGSTLVTDERGFARPTGSGVASDLGAVQTNYLTVTNLNDSGAGSLRQTILDANSAGAADIVFQSGVTGTITLASALPSITGNTNLAGPGAKLVTVSGAGNYAVLDIPNGSTLVNLTGLTIANGNTTGFAGGLSNSGLTTVESSAFSYNTGVEGGGIFNNGTLAVQSSTFTNNDATDGGGIDNRATLAMANGTFFGNRAYNGNGGGVENTAAAIVLDSTITGNDSLNGGVGAGMDNSGGSLAVSNSIVAANTNLQSNTEDDCNNCTQNGPILTGGNPDLGALAYNGLNATVQTMLPLPGSRAIQMGDPTQLTLGVTTDERGFARLTGGKLDLGAAQTNYTSVQLVQQPTDTFFNADISPAVTVEVLETNSNLPGPNNTDAVNGIPITLTLNGSGPLGGTLTQTTAGGVATFGDLMISTPGTGDTLATALTVTPSGLTPVQTLTATSNPFDITLLPSVVSFNPPLPASVTYGVAPLTLKATTTSSGTTTGQTVSFQVDSGPATVSGNVLTITGAGTVVVEVDAAVNGTYAASSATATITVLQAASQLALTASTSQAAIGSSVTLTATATSTAGIPTGTVTFMSGSTSLGTASLNAQGVATLAVTTLPAGSNTITATYAGDTNFTGSQAQLAGTIVVGTPGFSMTSSSSSLSVQPGLVGSMNLTLTPAFGYTGTVTLGCSGMPVQSTCVFQPSTVTFDGSGSSVQVSLTMEIGPIGLLSRDKSMAEVRPLTPLGSLPVLPAMIFWLPDNLPDPWRTRKLSEQRKTRTCSFRWLRLAVLLLFGAGLLGLTGCSNKAIDFNSPRIGQYTVTIMAAGSGNASQSVTVQLNVL